MREKSHIYFYRYQHYYDNIVMRYFDISCVKIPHFIV